MRGIIRFSQNNKFAIWIMTFIIVFGGMYAGLNMKQETIPNISVPMLTVNTIYVGAAPEQVAEKVSKPLEQRIQSLNGVSSVSSTSSENVSMIMIEYTYKKNMKEAENELREAVNGFDKPAGVADPSIMKINLNDFPIVSLSVSGKDMSLEQVTQLVENELQPMLEGIDGAGSVQISGQNIKEAVIKFDREKMASMGLSEDMVKGIIQASAVKAPLGLFEMDQAEKAIVVDGNITTLEQLKELAIPVMPSAPPAGATPDGGAAGQQAGASAGAGAAGAGAAGAAPGTEAPGAAGQGGDAAARQAAEAAKAAMSAGLPTVKLSEIADVQLVAKAESISRTNGQPSIGINVTKSSSANTVDVVNAVKEEAKKFEENNKGISTVIMLDQGKPIEDSVSTMVDKALFGALFAVIVILLFLRNIRTTIISVVSIPMSLLIAVLLLNQMDITLNIMTLGAMTVAIGRVVDDSIVVIENNYRRMALRSEKLRGKTLITEATKEMFIPILSSTLVTIAVFLPLGTVSGPIGELFMPFALTMVFALLASLLVAITIVPMMTHLMFRKGLKANQTHEEKPGKLGEGYRKLLKWSLNHKLITFLGAVVILIGSCFLTPLIGVSFLPEEEEKYAMVTYTPGPGKLLADVEAAALDAEKIIMAREGVENVQYSVGGQTPMGFGSEKSALFYIQYKNDTKNFAEEKDKLVEEMQKAESTGSWKQLDMSGGFGGSKISLLVSGDSFDEIKPIVAKIQEMMTADAAFEKVDNSLSKTYEQYTLVADQKKLSSLGLTAGQIAMQLSPARERPVLTTIEEGGKSYNVYLEEEKKQFASLKDIEDEKLASQLGIEVPVKDVVKFEKGTSANSVTRKDGKLYVEVSANVTVKDIGKASMDLETKVNKLEMPPTVKVEFGGVTEQINETFTQLGLAMAAAVAIVYLLLVITFGGAITPFAILFSLPFTIIGALVGLYIAGETISATAMMGMLMLIGIVVTNAIVLIDRVLNMEKSGLSTREALLEAAGTRLRPILMTALATIGALLPLVLGFEGGSGGLISKGLGVTVIGGLISSTLLTLLIVPIVYEFLVKFRRKSEVEE